MAFSWLIAPICTFTFKTLFSIGVDVILGGPSCSRDLIRDCKNFAEGSFSALKWTNARWEMDRNGAVAATDFISAENWEP